jgi:hypothetical protein
VEQEMAGLLDLRQRQGQAPNVLRSCHA